MFDISRPFFYNENVAQIFYVRISVVEAFSSSLLLTHRKYFSNNYFIISWIFVLSFGKTIPRPKQSRGFFFK